MTGHAHFRSSPKADSSFHIEEGYAGAHNGGMTGSHELSDNNTGDHFGVMHGNGTDKGHGAGSTHHGAGDNTEGNPGFNGVDQAVCGANGIVQGRNGGNLEVTGGFGNELIHTADSSRHNFDDVVYFFCGFNADMNRFCGVFHLHSSFTGNGGMFGNILGEDGGDNVDVVQSIANSYVVAEVFTGNEFSFAGFDVVDEGRADAGLSPNFAFGTEFYVMFAVSAVKGEFAGSIFQSCVYEISGEVNNTVFYSEAQFGAFI